MFMELSRIERWRVVYSHSSIYMRVLLSASVDGGWDFSYRGSAMSARNPLNLATKLTLPYNFSTSDWKATHDIYKYDNSKSLSREVKLEFGNRMPVMLMCIARVLGIKHFGFHAGKITIESV